MNLFDPRTKQILMQRLEKRLSEGRIAGIHQMGQKRLSPEQMIEEARQETEIGQEILFAEYKYMKFLESRM